MPEHLEIDAIRESLPGAWHIRATNFPMWVNGERRDPEVEYVLRDGEPSSFDDRVTYVDARGHSRTISGVDRWTRDHFVWRGAGMLRMLRSRWSISWLADDVMVTHFDKSRVTPAGTDIAIRAGTQHPELRRLIAGDPVGFGLTIEEFASLTWLDHIPTL